MGFRDGFLKLTWKEKKRNILVTMFYLLLNFKKKISILDEFMIFRYCENVQIFGISMEFKMIRSSWLLAHHYQQRNHHDHDKGSHTIYQILSVHTCDNVIAHQLARYTQQRFSLNLHGDMVRVINGGSRWNDGMVKVNVLLFAETSEETKQCMKNDKKLHVIKYLTKIEICLLSFLRKKGKL